MGRKSAINTSPKRKERFPLLPNTKLKQYSRTIISTPIIGTFPQTAQDFRYRRNLYLFRNFDFKIEREKISLLGRFQHYEQPRVLS